MDFDTLHQDMLAIIPDQYQKTVGFPVWDITKAFALGLQSLDEDIAVAEAHLQANNLTGEDLDNLIMQNRGLARRYATYAKATLRVVAGNGTISTGDIFSTASGVDFYAITDGTYAEGDTFEVQAYAGGTIGNVKPNTITYMPITIPGIGAVTNDSAAAGGYDAESDEEYLGRYYADLATPNNGANQQAYISWAMSVAGVGRVKVFPTANGPGTVDVCIVDSLMAPAERGLIQAVQALIDPNANGDGAGEAPIGAVCTVTTATALVIQVSAKITLAEGYQMSVVQASIQEALDAYLRSISFANDTTYISYAKMSSQINSTDGVFDHSALTINGGNGNIPLSVRQVPQLGEVILT